MQSVFSSHSVEPNVQEKVQLNLHHKNSLGCLQQHLPFVFVPALALSPHCHLVAVVDQSLAVPYSIYLSLPAHWVV